MKRSQQSANAIDSARGCRGICRGGVLDLVDANSRDCRHARRFDSDKRVRGTQGRRTIAEYKARVAGYFLCFDGNRRCTSTRNIVYRRGSEKCTVVIRGSRKGSLAWFQSHLKHDCFPRSSVTPHPPLAHAEHFEMSASISSQVLSTARRYS